MTFREILAGVQGNRRIIGTIRSTIDALMPGKLDQTISAKLVRGTSDVVLYVNDTPVGVATCEVIDCVPALADGKPVAGDGGVAPDVGAVGSNEHLG